MTTAEVIARHAAAGRFFAAGGVESFVREEGTGEVVLCLHGVPTSSFMYRKLVGELAARDLRGVAFDLPGLGLAARPENFDYTWSGLGRFATQALDVLELERVHLLCHDIGGPVAFELAAARPERVASLTILNTMIDVDTFRRPWVMEPFAWPGAGELYLWSLRKPVFRLLMHRLGVCDAGAVRPEESDAYVELLKQRDGGRAFLKIMRGFERTRTKRELYHGVVRDVPYPVQIVWGEQDPALALSHEGEEVRRAAGLDTIHRLPSKHFLPEDQAPAIADRVAAQAAGA